MLRSFAATLLLAFALVIPAGATSASIGPLAVEMCVTIAENTGLTGDKWTMCGLPSELKNANLDNDVTGLTPVSQPSCAGEYPQPDWNDCVSSFDYANMPANYRLRLYRNANYDAGIGFSPICKDVNGSPTGSWNIVGGMNDRVSSWRIEGGNCP